MSQENPSNPSNSAAQALQSLLDEERNKNEKLAQANAALIGEFASCENFDDMREAARKGMKDLAPDALNIIGALMKHSESDSVKASLSKWVVELLLSDRLTDSGEETLRGLMTQLAKNDEKASPAT